MSNEHQRTKKLFLDVGFDYDFLLLGIVSQEKFHRLVWLINQKLGYQFFHAGELEVFENEQVVANYTKYEFIDEINHLELFLFENRDQSNYLIPELRTIDYFLMLKGAIDFADVKSIIDDLKPLDGIQLVSEIDYQKLKSKQNLIF
jgi:hypothetical protein